MILELLLLSFCVFSIIFSLLVIISRNPVHSILYLILVFFCVSLVLLILGVEFIAITFLIVYVGAIAVLFLFVVMMLNIKILELDETFWRYIPVGLIISSLFFLQIFFTFFDYDWLNFLGFSDFYFVKKVSPSYYGFSKLHYSYANGIILMDIKDVDIASYHFSNILFSNNLVFIFFPWNDPYLLYLNYFVGVTNTEILGWLVYTHTFFVFLVISLILLVSMVGSIVLVLNQNINIKRQLIFRQTLKDLKSSVKLFK